MSKILAKNKYSILLVITTLICTAFLYRHALTSYFFQDDWFTFRISQAVNIADFLNFFIPRKDVIYFRPFGMQIPFFLMNQVWGINAVPYRLLTFFTHLVNTFLIYLLFKRLIRDKFYSWLGTFMYATSVVSLIPFYWFATYSFILCVTFFFLSSLFFLRFVDSKKYRFLAASFIFYIIGLLTNELVAPLPIIWSIYLILTKKYKMILYLLPHYLLTLLIIILRFVWFSPPTHGLYRMELGWHIFANLKTYFFWTFNWYEILTDQMIKPFIFSFWVMDYYPHFAYFSIIGFFILLALIFIGLFNLRQNKNANSRKLLVFAVIWYPVALLPVLLFNQHKFPYYLPVALTGFLLFFIILLKNLCEKFALTHKSWVRVIIMTVVISWFGVAQVTEEYFYLDHWAPRRALIAKKIIDNAQIKGNELTVFDSDENRLALNDQDGAKVIFGNRAITRYSTSSGGIR